MHAFHKYIKIKFSAIWPQTNAYFQEPNSEKTNNGIHYKLQLLYSNGKCKFLYSAGIDLQVFLFAQWSRIDLHLVQFIPQM